MPSKPLWPGHTVARLRQRMGAKCPPPGSHDWPGSCPTGSVRPLLLALVLLSSGCPFVVGVPPAKLDVGSMAISGEHENRPVRMSAGVSWASGSLDEDIPFDVSSGYLYELAESGAGAHGAFLQGQTRVGGGRYWRALAGLRTETIYDQAWAGGVGMRFDLELFGVGSGTAPLEDDCLSGIIGARGQTAIGTYVEAGYRHYPGEHVAMVTAGLSIRIPTLLAAGFVLPLPGC